MNFRYKCALQWLFSYLPYPNEWNYLAQKYLSRRAFPPDKVMEEKYQRALDNLEKFEKYCNKKLSDAVFYEFGAGWDLYLPMIFSTFGVGKLISTDLNPLSKVDAINHALSHVRRLADKNQIIPDKTLIFTKNNFRTILQEYFRINYQAPVDARYVSYSDNSIDFIYTNSVNQNIPQYILIDIVKECHRILKPDGIISFRQSYGDQWSYIDKSISRYNYLRYSEKQWKKYCPPLQYQNRLRHKDYLKIYHDAGFEVIEEQLDIPDDETRKMLENFPIAQEFREKYTIEELAINGSWMILKK
jgi:predicted SAM-dependent methyltransferase